MTDEQKAKRGRPAISPEQAQRNRIVIMVDDATHAWLTWHSGETGLSVGEVIRRAVAAYRTAQS